MNSCYLQGMRYHINDCLLKSHLLVLVSPIHGKLTGWLLDSGFQNYKSSVAYFSYFSYNNWPQYIVAAVAQLIIPVLSQF